MKLRELLHQIDLMQNKLGVPKCYICGGTPRDKYMNRLDHISDLDLTNGSKSIDYLSQEFAISLNKKYNITRKVMPDGHSTIYIGNLKMDFSSNFVVPNIEAILSKMNIHNPTDMDKEIYSRDFTCNSLLLSFDLKNIKDPTKYGIKDIKDKKIRTCLDPQITLTTNKNRVIRSIYLAAKLDFNIDNSIVEFVKNNPTTVKIATEKSLKDKLNDAFKWDADKSSYYITKMNLWDQIPITDSAYPYYIKSTKGI